MRLAFNAAFFVPENNEIVYENECLEKQIIVEICWLCVYNHVIDTTSGEIIE